MNDDWLVALIDYEEKHRPNNVFLPTYKKELIFRTNN
jgi:hypothetical protein